jgi:hypothetical protein
MFRGDDAALYAATERSGGPEMPTSMSLRAAGAAVAGQPPPLSLGGTGDGVWWREFTCVLCRRHYPEDLGCCPVDGGLLRPERISLPFLWLG